MSSSSAVPDVKYAGPSSNCTGTISSELLLVMLTVRTVGRLFGVALEERRGLGGVSSSVSSMLSIEFWLAVKLSPANPMADWNAPLSAMGDIASPSSACCTLRCCPDGVVTNAVGWPRGGGLGEPSCIGVYGACARSLPAFDRPARNSSRPLSLRVRRCDSSRDRPPTCPCVPFEERFWS